MRTFVTLLLAAGVGLSVSASPAVAQPGGARQRSLYVSATTEDGTPVETLTPADVIVREDGVTREVLKVARATEPVDITLLVDNSTAATRALQDMRLALEKFVETYAGPHTISLVTVADRPTVQVKSTTNKAALVRGVKRLFVQPDAGATLIEGIIDVSKSLAGAERRRAAIIAITTFGTEFSDRGFQYALDELARSGAVLHVLELQDTQQADPSSQNVRDRNIVIDRGTSETGGLRELLVTNLSLTDRLQKVGKVITSQFEVQYGRPDTLIPPRKVEVLSARPDLKLRANVLQANRTER
jgi:hypothetical protein